MTYSSRSVGGLLPGRLVAFIPAALAASALGTGGCSIDFSAACARGRQCDDGPTAIGAGGSVALATGGTGDARSSAFASGTSVPETDSGAGTGGSATIVARGPEAAPPVNAGGTAGAAPGSDAGATAGGTAGAPPVGGKSGACARGFEDCNGDPADGCEVDTRTNADHCGACGSACSNDGVRARFCVEGTCAPTCLNYHGDCFADANDGCETLLVDSANCGGCGHDCGNAACLADSQCGAVDIASNVRGVSRVAVTTDTVYWTESSADDSKTMMQGAWRIDGQPSPRTFETSRRIADFTAAGDELYITFGTTQAEPLDGSVARWMQGGPPEDIVTGIAPAFVAATSEHVYWTDIVVKAVYQAQRDGKGLNQVSDAGDLPFELTPASEDTVFGATTGGLLFRTSPTHGKRLRSDPPAQSLFVAVDGSNVFAWTSDGHTAGLGRYDTMLSTDPVIILSEPNTSSLGRGLAAAAGEVFFAREDGIYRVPGHPSAGDPRQLVATSGIVLQIVIREHTLYWVELAADRQTGSVRSVNFY